MIKFKKLNKEAQVPSYAKEWDAWLDVRSLENVVIKPGQRYKFNSWLAIEVPVWYAAIVNWRSWNAVKYGIDTIWNVIDENYRWEFGCILQNNWQEDFIVYKWDRVAQLLIIPVLNNVEVVEVKELSESNRWTDWFGSTWSK